MKIPDYKIFNGQELSAFKDINGSRIELMELKEIQLTPNFEKTPLQILGSRTIQYKTNYIGLIGQAKVNSISYKGQDIINNTYENLRFMLYKDGTTLNCCIEDIGDIVEDEHINFTAE